MPVLLKVFDETKTSKHLVLCNDVHDLLSKGKEKLDLPNDVTELKAVLGDGTEISDDEVIPFLQPMTEVLLLPRESSSTERIIDSFDLSILKWPPVEVSTPEGLDDETQSDDSTMRTGADLRPLSPLSDTSTSCLSSCTSSTDCTGEPGKKRKIQTSLSFIPKAKRIDVIALLSTKGIKLYTDDQIRKAQGHLKKPYQFVNMYYRQLMEDVKCRQLNKTELKGMVEVAWTLHCSEQSVIDSKKATALLERVKDKASADQLNMITVQKNVDRVEKAKFSITQCQKKNKRSQSRPGAKAIKRQKQGI